MVECEVAVEVRAVCARAHPAQGEQHTLTQGDLCYYYLCCQREHQNNSCLGCQGRGAPKGAYPDDGMAGGA